ncbi:MAG: hypothetical protein ACO1SV_06155 [Fimbriimonas sp.]
MFLVAALAALAVPALPAAGTVWRYPGEVRALVSFGGNPVAASAAGVFVRRGGAWSPLGEDSPTGLVSLTLQSGELLCADAAGRAFRLRDGRWQLNGTRAAGTQAPGALDAPPPGSKGAFLSASTSDGGIRSYWGDTHLWRFAHGEPSRWIARAPSVGDYALLPYGNDLLAGTPDGVFSFGGDAWKPEPLPGALPLARPHGIAYADGRWIVGGLQGLWMGQPGAWEEVDRTPVRQILRSGNAVWVLFGSGALDKLEPSLDRRHPDVLHGAARRPWASSLALGAGGLLIGTEGGWIEKRGDFLAERYPPELSGQVITALLARGDSRFVGTQKGGLYEFSPRGVKTYNPGNGLRDAWVTALAHDGKRLTIATANAGLFTLRNGRITPRPGPTSRPYHLAMIGDALYVGGMDGAWRATPRGWHPLSPGEETTAIAYNGRQIAIATAAGIHFFNR